MHARVITEPQLILIDFKLVLIRRSIDFNSFFIRCSTGFNQFQVELNWFYSDSDPPGGSSKKQTMQTGANSERPHGVQWHGSTLRHSGVVVSVFLADCGLTLARVSQFDGMASCWIEFLYADGQRKGLAGRPPALHA